MTRQTAPEKKFMALSPVGRAVRPLIVALLPKKSALFQQVFEVWPDLVANTEAMGSIPEKLVLDRGEQNDGVLHLWATTGAQATEMTFNAAAFIRKINALFGYNLVGSLRVTAFPKIMAKESLSKVASRRTVSCQSLDKDLSGISNPALQSILRELGGVLDSAATSNTEKGESHA